MHWAASTGVRYAKKIARRRAWPRVRTRGDRAHLHPWRSAQLRLSRPCAQMRMVHLGLHLTRSGRRAAPAMPSAYGSPRAPKRAHVRRAGARPPSPRGSKCRCGSGSQPLPALSRKILGHPSKKRPHQGFSRGKFVDSADRFYQRGGRSPLCCGRPVKHNDRSWGGCGAAPLYVRQPRHPPLGSKNAFRTDAFVETRLIHATCTSKAFPKRDRSEAAFTTESLWGSPAHLQGL